jgi:hypothetical protein
VRIPFSTGQLDGRSVWSLKLEIEYFRLA